MSETSKATFNYALEEGKSMGPHVLKMIGLFDNMETLRFLFCKEIATIIVLHSVPDGYEKVKLNFNMNGMEKSLTELHGMLKTNKPNVKPKSKTEILVVQKRQGTHDQL